MDRRYPIGPLAMQNEYTREELSRLTDVVEAAPATYRATVADLSPTELAQTYRQGSWTIQQLVHHVADIQLLHLLRMKKALTEPDYAVVTLIDMDRWAATEDASSAPVEDSLLMFEGIQRRYVRLIRSLDTEQLAIAYHHPVRQRAFTQTQAVAMSAWHVAHHLAHIRLALGQPIG